VGALHLPLLPGNVRQFVALANNGAVEALGAVIAMVKATARFDIVHAHVQLQTAAVTHHARAD